MRVMHIVEGISPRAGGPTRSVKGLTTALARQGVDVFLFAHSPLHDWPDSAPVHFQKGIAARGAKAAYELEQSILSFKPDIVHLHGLWMNHRDVQVALRLKIPIVLSPRGMLDPWALSVKKWKKRLAMVLYQRRDLKRVSAFHATAELEASNIRAQGFNQPIIVSPNGVDAPFDDIDACRKSSVVSSGSRTAIFMGRLHPGKGLITLAEAWARVRPKDWIMRIVGPDSCGHKTEVLARLDELGISYSDVKARTSGEYLKSGEQRTSWEFVDIVDDKTKWVEYAAADLLVHPSVSENFGMTIAEGLAAGIPVVCTKGAPWQDLEKFHCGWWVDADAKSLAMALGDATIITAEERHEMGVRGRKLVEEKYVWDMVVKDVVKGYERMIA